jgi:polar amino acid transport system substrate-binding protein
MRRPLRPFNARVNRLLLALAVSGLALVPTPLWAETVLRVGVTNGSQPCSFRIGGVWQGLAVDLWQQVASHEKLPYRFSEWPSPTALLEAAQLG